MSWVYGVFARHFSEDGEFAGAHNVDGNIRFGTGGKDLVDARVVGFDLDACKHDSCTNYAWDGRSTLPSVARCFRNRGRTV